jgi:hypothetical protein
VKLSDLRDARQAGFMINDALVLTVDVTVEREDRFQLDTGWSPPLCMPGVRRHTRWLHAAGGAPRDPEV